MEYHKRFLFSQVLGVVNFIHVWCHIVFFSTWKHSEFFPFPPSLLCHFPKKVFPLKSLNMDISPPALGEGPPRPLGGGEEGGHFIRFGTFLQTAKIQKKIKEV